MACVESLARFTSGIRPARLRSSTSVATTGTATATRRACIGRPRPSLTNPARTGAYDSRNRLVQGASGAGTATYRYDCLGRRIEKNVTGTITRFYYDGTEEIEEQNAGDATVATYVYSKGRHTRLQMA